jgi:hypothetical protein
MLHGNGWQAHLTKNECAVGLQQANWLDKLIATAGTTDKRSEVNSVKILGKCARFRLAQGGTVILHCYWLPLAGIP